MQLDRRVPSQPCPAMWSGLRSKLQTGLVGCLMVENEIYLLQNISNKSSIVQHNQLNLCLRVFIVYLCGRLRLWMCVNILQNSKNYKKTDSKGVVASVTRCCTSTIIRVCSNMYSQLFSLPLSLLEAA